MGTWINNNNSILCAKIGNFGRPHSDDSQDTANPRLIALVESSSASVAGQTTNRSRWSWTFRCRIRCLSTVPGPQLNTESITLRQAGRRNVQKALLLSQNTEYQNRIKIGKRRLQAQANNLIIGHRGWINLSFGTKDNLLAAVPWYCCSLQSAPWLCDLRSVQKSICQQKGQSFVLLPLLMMVWMIITRNGYTRD